MIDTMTIYYQLTKYEYNRLFESIKNLSIKLSGKKLYKDRNDKNAFVTNALSTLGYQEIWLRQVRTPFDYRAIEVRVRPKLLIDKNNYYELIQPNEIEQARGTFNHLFGQLKLPDMLYWKVKRIDYAMDLEIYQELIPIYMLLFKKSNLPYFVLNNEITKKYMESTTNLYLYSKNVTINFYDRYNTLINKQKELSTNWDGLEITKNKLRLEIQYKKCEGELIDFFNFRKYKKSILGYYESIIGAGDYFPLDQALDIITKSTKSFKTGVILRNFVKLVHQNGGVWKAKEVFLQKNSAENREKAQKKFSDLLNKIRKLGINPVSLDKEYELESLPNLLVVINQRLDEMELELN